MSEERMGNVPPQDLHAEQSVIGAMTLSRDAFDEVSEFLKPEHFYSHSNRQLFDCLSNMHDRGDAAVDVVTITHELRKRGEFEEIGGSPYLNEVMGAVPHIANCRFYATIVVEKAKLRRLIEAASKILKECYTPTDDSNGILARAEKRVLGVMESFEDLEDVTLQQILQESFDAIYQQMEQEAPEGVSTGLHKLDELTAGFHPTELLVLAARPAMGKTALICNFALTVAKAGRGVMLFSLEQPKKEIADRLLCIQGKVNGAKLRKGELTPEEQQRLIDAANDIRNLQISIDDKSGRTVSQIAAISRRAHRRTGGLGLIVIDYLQLIEAEDPRLQREQQIAGITRRLKFLAKDLSVPVLALAQLNRGVENREEKRPRLSDLRESGAIEQDADIVMLLHRPEVYDPADRPGEADLIVAKNRHGPVGNVPLVWLSQSLKFGDKAESQFTF